MRPLLQNRTPAQLLWMIAALNILVSMSFGMLGLRLWRLPQSQQLPHSLLWVSFGVLILSLIGDLIAEQNLRDGISAERWPDKLLDGPRKLFAGPAFSILNVFLLVASCAYVFFSHPHNVGGAWAFLYPALSLTRVISAMRKRPSSSTDRLLTRIEPPKPLHSEHWKTPPHPFTS